jgi:FkbM family methyltransferase
MLKKIFLENSHNFLFRKVVGLGRLVNDYYENVNYDERTNGELRIFKKISKFNPGIIIDGGANVGYFAKAISSICKTSEIYSFEPVEQTFEILQSNLADISNVKAINKGLYSENCSKIINLFTHDEHASIYDLNNVFPEKSKGAIKINLIKGDDFLSENNIEKVFFLKLDIEGAEYDALLGFENALKNNHIKIIQFEYGYICIKSKRLLVDYYELLESYGFVLGKVFPKKVDFRTYQTKHENFLGPNYIAVHKSETAIIEALS